MNTVIERENVKMPNKEDGRQNRSDGWTPEEDRIVIDIVLNFIRMRKTQLKAFKRATRDVKRTSSAIAYRWNRVLRHLPEIEEQIQEIREQQRRQDIVKDKSTNRKGWISGKRIFLEGEEIDESQTIEQVLEVQNVIELPREVCEDIDLYKMEQKEYDLLYIVQQDTELSNFLKDPENVKLYMDALRFGYEPEYDAKLDAYSHYLQVNGDRPSLSLNEFLKVVQYAYEKIGGIEHGGQN
jgi:hypothetical protein